MSRRLTLADVNETSPEDFFEPPAWDQRYSKPGEHWSGEPNAQLVAIVTGMRPGTALDVGCGEGGDVLWLTQQGWRVTGADFSSNGLRRAAVRLEQAGLGQYVDWWQIDAREFDPAGRGWDLVTTHFLHPPEGGMVDVTRRLTSAVAPGGHLLVVGHAPSHHIRHLNAEQRRAMWLAKDLLPALPQSFELLIAEQRPRTMVHNGQAIRVDDSTLLARRPR